MIIEKVQAIIYKKEKNQKKFLILHRKLHWSGWELLKETVEKGESHEETLVRGIWEEIRVKQSTIEKAIDVNIPFNEKEGIVKVFIVQINPKEKINIAEEREHDEYKWVTKQEAEKLLTYENTKEVIRKYVD